MTRSKDQNLADHCRAMGEAATASLGWFADNEKMVGNRRGSLDKAFKRRAVTARKLAVAATRPMSVGVFGASQAGKSFLIGSFIAPADRPAKVVFGEGESAVSKDFLNEVNPTGGDETTGLVTRFSLTTAPSPSPAHPVVLRLLNETDIVKILANTFALDLRGRPDHLLTPDRLQALFGQVEGVADPARPQPGMVAEDVYELEDYLDEEIDAHPLSPNGQSAQAAKSYWLELERSAPYLPAKERAALLAPLWGEVPELTDLYLLLKDALDQLGHAETAYAPLSAIEDRSHGILHVQTVYGIDAGAGDTRPPVEIFTGTHGARLAQPVVAALTAELRVRLDERPWEFFEHTDLLDFPGARGRENKLAKDYLKPDGEEFKPTNRAYCFLRGKIAVLFDKYSADLDLNTMLLCSDDRNQEVRKLAELVNRWVGRTNGVLPGDRRGKRTTLFLCLTKADTLFDQMAGAEVDKKIHARVKKDMDFYTLFTEEWTPGKPFDNVFLVRNPKFVRKDLFDYGATPPDGDSPPEIAIKADQMERLDGFIATFVNQEIVARHVAEPRDKIEAVLSLNDGGIAHLAKHLAPTCDPDLKYDQIAPRASKLQQELLSDLEAYHEGGDLDQRIRERVAAATAVARAFAASNSGANLGPFLSDMSVTEADLGVVFLDTARGRAFEPGEDAPTADASLGRGASGGVELDLDFLDELEDQPPSKPQEPQRSDLAARFGAAAVSHWLDRIERRASNPDAVKAYGLEEQHVRTVLNEMTVAARRFGLADRVSEQVASVVQYFQRPDEQVHRVALIAALEINDLVMRLGRNLPQAEDGTDLFGKIEAPPTGGLPELPVDIRQMQRVRGRRLSDWLKALVILAKENARSASGSLVDVDQNRILGRLISKIRGAS